MKLPEGWTRATIGDCVEAGVEQRVPDRDVCYVDIGSIDRTSKRIQAPQYIQAAKAPTRAKQWVREGDVLVSLTRPNLNAVAKVTREFASSVASTGFDVLRASGVLPEWLYYRVMTQAFVQDVSEGVQGVVYPAIRPADVRQHILPIAPREEQARTVEAVEDYLSRLDAAAASLEQAQTKLKAYRASVLKAAVEGRLVPTEAELARTEQRDYEPADVLLKRILAERQRRWQEAELTRLTAAGKRPKDDKWKSKYQEPAAPDLKALPTLPEGWSWATLDALIIDGPQNGVYIPSEKYGRGFPIVRIDDFQVGSSRSSGNLQRVELSEREQAKYALRPGDLVVNRVNSPTHLGKTFAAESRHLPAVFESNMMRFSVAAEILPAYMQMYLNSNPGKIRLIENAKWAVNQASINQRDVVGTAIPLPPAVEQHRIAAEVDRALTVGAETLQGIRNEAHRIVRLRQSILKWAFEGKLVDQDPNDEPAERLLERICNERAANAPAKKTTRRRRKTKAE